MDRPSLKIDYIKPSLRPVEEVETGDVSLNGKERYRLPTVCTVELQANKLGKNHHNDFISIKPNNTGNIVMKVCNGKRTVSEILQKIIENYPFFGGLREIERTLEEESMKVSISEFLVHLFLLGKVRFHRKSPQGRKNPATEKEVGFPFTNRFSTILKKEVLFLDERTKDWLVEIRYLLLSDLLSPDIIKR